MNESNLKKLDGFEVIILQDQMTFEQFIGIYDEGTSFALNTKLEPKDVPHFDPSKKYNVYLHNDTENNTYNLYIKIDNDFVGPIFIPEHVMDKFVK